MGSTPLFGSAEELAADLSHQLASPLTALLVDLELAMEHIAPQAAAMDPARAFELLQDVRHAAIRIGAVLEHMRLQVLAEAPLLDAMGACTDDAMATSAATRVLIVDDDVLVGRSLRRSLRGLDVAVFSDAESALARLRAGDRFDFILCDVMMPGMSGVGFFEAVAELDGAMAKDVVFMTGGTTNEKDRAFLVATGNRVLAKPFEIDVLLRMVHAPTARP